MFPCWRHATWFAKKKRVREASYFRDAALGQYDPTPVSMFISTLVSDLEHSDDLNRGQNHSAAYAGCSMYKEAKEIKTISGI